MRRGMRVGPDDTTALWLPGDSITDQSGNALTVTTSTTAPSPASGYFDLSRSYANSGFLSVASAAAINFSGDFFVEAWVKPSAAANDHRFIAGRIDGSADGYAWKLGAQCHLEQTYGDFTVTDAAGTTQYLQSYLVPTNHDPARWFHIAAAFKAGSYMAIWINGHLQGYATTALANVNNVGVGALRIGLATGSPTWGGNPLTTDWAGLISDLRILTRVPDISELSPNLEPARITRRQIHAYDVELGQMVQGETWTNSSGAYYIGQGDFPTGALITATEDLVSAETATAAGVIQALTVVSNVVDCRATNNTCFWDEPNGRFYVRAGAGVDPATFRIVRLRFRYRAATHGWLAGDRWYRPSVLADGTQSGEIFGGLPFQAIPTTGGGSLSLARQFSDHPAGFGSEEASQVMWTGSPVRERLVSDGVPWAEAIDLCTGRVEVPPGDDRDKISVTWSGELARIYRNVFNAAAINMTDFPNAPVESDGKPIASCWGPGLLRVPAWKVDKANGITATFPNNATATFYKYKFCAHKVARINQLGNGVVGGYPMANVDLSAGTFYAQTIPNEAYWVDVEGYGTPTTATSSSGVVVYSFGTASDSLLTPNAMIKELLNLYLEVAAADRDEATFTDTASRVQIHRRWAEVLDSADSVAAELQRFSDETMTRFYPERSGLFAWKDVNKSAAVTYTLLDSDIIDDKLIFDTSQIAKEMQGSAYVYQIDSKGALKRGSLYKLVVDSDAKYDAKRVWYPPPGSSPESLSRILTNASFQLWFAAIRKFIEEPFTLREIVVSARLARAEIMDVISDSTSNLPAGIGTRFRVFRRRLLENGNMALSLFSETPWPASGYSAAAVRDAYKPIKRWSYEGADTGVSCATTGSWTRVGDNMSIYLGATCPSPASGVTTTLAIYAQRVGGAVDADFQLRLARLDSSGAYVSTIAAISGVSTTAGFVSTTTVTLPTVDCPIQLQYLAAVGVSGTVWCGTLEASETAAAPGDPVTAQRVWETGSGTGWTLTSTTRNDAYKPTLQFAWGNSAGTALPNQVAWTTIASVERPWHPWNGFPTGTVHSFQVTAIRVGGTDVEVRLFDTANSATVATVTGIGTASIAIATTSSVTPPATNARLLLQYRTTGGASGTIYSSVWASDSSLGETGDDVEPTLVCADGNSSSITVSSNGAMNFRAFAIDATSADTLLGVEYRAVIAYDINTATGFRPTVKLYGRDPNSPYTRRAYTACDFGVIGGSAGTVLIQSRRLTLPSPTAGVAQPPYELYFEATRSSGSALVYGMAVVMKPTNTTVGQKYVCMVGPRHGIGTLRTVAGMKAWAAIRYDATGTTNFHPVIQSDEALRLTIADFGILTGSGIKVVPAAAFQQSGMEPMYTSDAGSPVISAITLDFVYPETT